MLDKTKLGGRYSCFKCGTKFYDLNRPEPTCPECTANQKEAPVRDIRSLLNSGRNRHSDEGEEEATVEEVPDDDEDDDLGVLNDMEDDDDAPEGEEEEESGGEEEMSFDE